MNILQILPELNVGGVETGTVDLAKHLVRRGHRSVVVSAGGALVAELEAMGIAHITLPVASKAWWVMLGAARDLAKIIKQERIDVVHARSRVPAWVAFMACRSTGTPLVTTAHGHYSRHIFSFVMGWGKFTIVPSAMIGKHMMEDFGVPRENVKLIPRSVDLERYLFRGAVSASKRELTVGVIGRVTPIKGQIYFLKAMALVVREFPRARGWIVGGVSAGKDGYMEELEVMRRRLGLVDQVEFLGNRRDVPEVLRQLDCCVMPSVAEESFGRVIVEAQAIGVPMVATRVGGVVEIVTDGVDGLLVEARDHEALAAAILRVLKDEAFARSLIANGRQKVEAKYSLDQMAQATIDVYQETVERSRILVVKWGAVGDVILSIASLEAIRRRFPTAHVTCLVGLEAKDALIRCPYVDELIICDFKGKDRGVRAFFGLARRLMARRFDRVVDLQNNRKSHFLSYLTFSARRYGYDNGKGSFLLNRKVKVVKAPLDPVSHQFRTLALLGIERTDESLKLWPSHEDRETAAALLGPSGTGAGPWIGINVGSSARWTSKRWPVRNFVSLCEELVRQGYSPVLTGTAADRETAERILKALKVPVLCVVGRTRLLELAAIVERCRAFVTGDSAPLHVAAAMRTPWIALFGPTDPRRHAPAGTPGVVLQKGCVPCYKDTCPKKHHACLAGITPQDVVEAVRGLSSAEVRS